MCCATQVEVLGMRVQRITRVAGSKSKDEAKKYLDQGLQQSWRKNITKNTLLVSGLSRAVSLASLTGLLNHASPRGTSWSPILV